MDIPPAPRSLSCARETAKGPPPSNMLLCTIGVVGTDMEEWKSPGDCIATGEVGLVM